MASPPAQAPRTARVLKSGRRLPHSERRESILRAAIRLFAEHGYHGVTTRELAAASGVSEPILYRHFPTKQDLYSAIIEYKAKAGIAALEQALEPYVRERDDRGYFRELARFVLGHYRRDPDYVRLLLYSGLEGHELAQMFFDRQVAEYSRQVRSYLQKRMREGKFRRIKPHLAARAIAGMMNHHALVGLLFRDHLVPEDAEEVIEAFVSVFLRGVERT